MALNMYGVRVCVCCVLWPLASMGELTVLSHTLWLGACPEVGHLKVLPGVLP